MGPRALRRRYGKHDGPKQRGAIDWYVVLEVRRGGAVLPMPGIPGMYFPVPGSLRKVRYIVRAMNRRHAEAKAERLATDDGYAVESVYEATVKSDPIYKFI